MRYSRQECIVTLLSGITVFLLGFQSCRMYGTFRTVVPNSVLLQQELERNPNWKEHGLNFQSVKESTDLPLPRLKAQLSAEFPYEPLRDIPKNVWQTWKVGLDDETFPDQYHDSHRSWEEMNPDYRLYVVSDSQCDAMVKVLFQDVPDVVEAWISMPKIVLKADFFRYLILFARGGIYSDIDTKALKPASTWISAKDSIYNKPNTAGLVVGIEADNDRPDWADWFARQLQFCQWTIQAKKGHPMLRDLIARITNLTLERKKMGELNKVIGKNGNDDVLNWTGPGMFTDVVFDYMNIPFSNVEVKADGERTLLVSRELFTGMRVPIMMDDVLILPITSFSPQIGAMGAGDITDKWAYLQHLFSGSWKGSR